VSSRQAEKNDIGATDLPSSQSNHATDRAGLQILPMSFLADSGPQEMVEHSSEETLVSTKDRALIV